MLGHFTLFGFRPPLPPLSRSGHSPASFPRAVVVEIAAVAAKEAEHRQYGRPSLKKEKLLRMEDYEA